MVAEASDGCEAVEKFQETNPDLITLDLVMPKVDGLEAIKRLRAVDRDVKIVVISALDQRHSLLEAMRLGADDYVVKPFDAECIQDAVNRVMTATV